MITLTRQDLVRLNTLAAKQAYKSRQEGVSSPAAARFSQELDGLTTKLRTLMDDVNVRGRVIVEVRA